MKYRKMIFMTLLALFVFLPGIANYAAAADRNESYGVRIDKVVKKYSNISSLVKTKYHDGDKLAGNSKSKKNPAKLSGLNYRHMGSNNVRAILDYDDYTQIFKILENKE